MSWRQVSRQMKERKEELQVSESRTEPIRGIWKRCIAAGLVNLVLLGLIVVAPIAAQVTGNVLSHHSITAPSAPATRTITDAQPAVTYTDGSWGTYLHQKAVNSPEFVGGAWGFTSSSNINAISGSWTIEGWIWSQADSATTGADDAWGLLNGTPGAPSTGAPIAGIYQNPLPGACCPPVSWRWPGGPASGLEVSGNHGSGVNGGADLGDPYNSNSTLYPVHYVLEWDQPNHKMVAFVQG